MTENIQLTHLIYDWLPEKRGSDELLSEKFRPYPPEVLGAAAHKRWSALPKERWVQCFFSRRPHAAAYALSSSGTTEKKDAGAIWTWGLPLKAAPIYIQIEAASAQSI